MESIAIMNLIGSVVNFGCIFREPQTYISLLA